MIWMCLATIIGFYAVTSFAICVQLFSRRCPSCGASLSPVADAVVDGALKESDAPDDHDE